MDMLEGSPSVLQAIEASPVADPVASGIEHAPDTGGYTPAMVQAMQRAMIELFARWGVGAEDAAILLGGISSKTFRRWRDGDYGRVSRDQADRMSLLLGVHKALRILYVDAARGYRWMSAANTIFGGRSALDVMLRGGIDDIRRIRSYLDAARG